ncbi:unnamed protein product [Rotaria socialis]
MLCSQPLRYYYGSSWVTYEPYDNSTQSCCKSADYRTTLYYGFTSTVAYANTCCLEKPYNYTKNLVCCAGTFYNTAAHASFTSNIIGVGDACCGPNPYSTGAKKCCENWSTGDECCGLGSSNNAYNTSTHVCCGNLISGEGNACCVIDGYYHTYDSRKSCCTPDEIVHGITCAASALNSEMPTVGIIYAAAYSIFIYFKKYF